MCDAWLNQARLLNILYMCVCCIYTYTHTYVCEENMTQKRQRGLTGLTTIHPSPCLALTMTTVSHLWRKGQKPQHERKGHKGNLSETLCLEKVEAHLLL